MHTSDTTQCLSHSTFTHSNLTASHLSFISINPINHDTQTQSEVRNSEKFLTVETMAAEEESSSTASNCLRMPYLFEIDLRTCRYYGTSKQCFDIDPIGLRVAAQPKICNQCSIKILSIACTEFNTNTKTAHLLKKQNILMFANLFRALFSHPNNLYYFLQNKQTFNRYLFTMMEIIRKLKNSNNVKLCEYYTIYVSNFMRFVGQKRHLIKWFIEAQNGKYFKQFVIDEFNKYKHKNNNNNKNKLSERYLWMYPVITFINKKHEYYIKKAIIKKDLYKGKTRRNYIWIERILQEKTLPATIKYGGINDLEFLFCYDESKRQRVNFGKMLKKNIICDNRECPLRSCIERVSSKSKFRDKNGRRHEIIIERGKVHKGKWYKCKRCRMMYYCSRRCQKIDWNKYYHKSLCFQYPLHGKQKRDKRTVEGKQES